MAISLTERLAKADNRIKALKENATAMAAGKAVVHKGLEKGPQLKEMEAYKQFLRAMSGDTKGVPSVKTNLKEMLTSTDIIDQLIPNVIVGEMLEAAEPELLFSNLFQKVTAPAGGVTVIVPAVGEIFAKEVGEAEPYNEDTMEMNLIENNRLKIDIKKVGLKVSISEEAMTDYTWDIYNLTIRKMGRAFARFKEEKCMKEATKHGHVVFDNAYRQQKKELGTTGLGIDGKPNNTLSMEDFLDMMLAGITNHHTPTDFFAHPLIWAVFAKNGMAGAGMQWGALGGQNINPTPEATQGAPNYNGLQNNMGPQKFIMTPDQVQNRMPFALTVNLTPFVNFDKEKKQFDCYIVDRNNVGVIAQRSELAFDNWNNPERDIQFIKANERYGVGIQDHGLGIMVARNIAADVTYPRTIPVHVVAD